ncbi:MAG: hypothetical protein PF495_01860 [Spirochaetales bacterium]|jgi:hypothetical protein|nr:hypothetical protein [Spirochaetales bacterium]
MKQIINKLTAALLAISLTGCSLVIPENLTREELADNEEMKSTVAKSISEQWEYIEGEIDELPSSMRAANGKPDTSLIVNEMLKEEKGQEYLEFTYSVASGADADTVMAQAEVLLPEEKYQELVDQVGQARSVIYETYGSRLFALDDENRSDFYKDLRKLVVSTIVLLTASVVYSAMPHIFFWGKISALAAVSVSAGAAAGTVISVYDWYVNDKDMFDAFNDWINMITDEPYAAYLMATSVVSLGQSMNLNPISCSVILGVFTVFNALNIVRDMIESYGKET